MIRESFIRWCCTCYCPSIVAPAPLALVLADATTTTLFTSQIGPKVPKFINTQ